MTFQDTQPAALDAGGEGDPWAEFRVQHPKERADLLRRLRDGSVPINLNAPDGAVVSATLWSIDVSRLAFAADGNAPSLSRLIEANEAIAVAYLDNVKLQFDLADLVLVRGGMGHTLQCSPPAEIYRFQRRGAYRVRPPERATPLARLRHPAIPEMRLSLRVLDLSIGGVALWLPDDVPALEPGTRIEGVAVELDESTRFAAALTLHHISAMGGGGRRVGCEWHLRGDAERLLQRWIDQVQKRRRMLASISL